MHSPLQRSKAILIALLMALFPLTAQAQGKFTNLGQPIHNIINEDSCVGMENNRAVDYIVIKGANDSTTFDVVDIISGKVLKKIPLPGVSGSWAVQQASDGKVYIGSHYKACFYQYTPGSDHIINLGAMGKETHVFDMVAGKDGKIYAGTYPNAHVYEYDPHTEKITDLGRVSQDQNYVRSLAFDGDANVLYAGVGGSKAELIKIDLATGNKKEILEKLLPADHPHYPFAYHMDYALGKLFVKVMPDTLILDTATQTVEYYHPGGAINMGSQKIVTLPGDNDHIYFGSKLLYRYNVHTHKVDTAGPGFSFQSAKFLQLHLPDYPGYTFVATGQKGQNYLYNLETKKALKPVINDDGSAILIRSLTHGPDGKIYIGGYLGASGFISYDPLKSTFGPVQQFGQTEAAGSLGKMLYAGNYPGAHIWQYNPAQKWSAQNPKSLFKLHNEKQDRPFALLGVDELQKLYIGSVPDYPYHSGALTVYDVATKQHQSFIDIVKNQSVISLVYKDGLLYGGTTIDGGLGTTGPVAKAGKLFVFDTKTNKKILEFTPNPTGRDVSGLLVGPDGLIWGVAEDIIFKYDPAKRAMVFQKSLLPRHIAKVVWADASLVLNPDGNVYGTNKSGIFFKINPKDMSFTVVKRDAGRYLVQDDAGNLYMSNDSYLWKYTPQSG